MDPRGPTAEPIELSARHWPEQDLLVVTDGLCRGRNALALPFRQASVLEMTPDRGGAVEGEFDTVVVDCGPFQLHRLDGVLRWVLPTLRPGGQVIIILDPDGCSDPAPAESPALAGLCWRGLATLNRRPCALLTMADNSSSDALPPAVLLPIVITALRLAYEQHAPIHAALDRAKQRLTEQMERRRQSEGALLDHLASLADELDRARHQLDGLNAVRTLLKRSRPGRATLYALRPGWRAARSLKRRFRALRTGRASP